MVTEKYNRQEEYLTGMIKQRQEAVDDHISGRKLMNDEVSIISLDIYLILIGGHGGLFHTSIYIYNNY